MHVGHYDNEPVTIAVLDDFIKKSCYEAHIDLQQHFHHAIYLSDPRKTAQDRLKTVIRYPVKIALPPTIHWTSRNLRYKPPRTL